MNSIIFKSSVYLAAAPVALFSLPACGKKRDPRQNPSLETMKPGVGPSKSTGDAHPGPLPSETEGTGGSGSGIGDPGSNQGTQGHPSSSKGTGSGSGNTSKDQRR